MHRKGNSAILYYDFWNFDFEIFQLCVYCWVCNLTYIIFKLQNPVRGENGNKKIVSFIFSSILII